MDCLVMFFWVMLACIIGTIVYATTPKVKELALCIAAFEPMEALIHQFQCLWSHDAMMRPWAVMLLVVIMVRLSCGCPISSRVVQMGTASLNCSRVQPILLQKLRTQRV
jgi:hypothetical protein